MVEERDSIQDTGETTAIVGLEIPEATKWEVADSLEELRQLVTTAGGDVVRVFTQKRRAIHPRTYIGPGKAREINSLIALETVDSLIVDGHLSPSQQRNLEDIIDCKVLDRPAVILDIFAQRAHSAEGKVQVELAQLSYRLPRLVGRGVELSRLGGGIGTRGPGETKLEVDRRRINHRIRRLKKELDDRRRTRGIKRQRRTQESFTVSLVGYTNAGKSTLLNKLTKSTVLVEDRLFATLDPTSRRLALDSPTPIILTDTVGFIRALPPELIAAFRSTLEEVRESSLIVHVIDASHPKCDQLIKVVEDILADIGADQVDRQDVYNKVDLLSHEDKARIITEHPQATLVAALTGEGLDVFKKVLEVKATRDLRRIQVLIPFTEGGQIQELNQRGRVIEQKVTEEGTVILVELRQHDVPHFKRYMTADGGSDT